MNEWPESPSSTITNCWLLARTMSIHQHINIDGLSAQTTSSAHCNTQHLVKTNILHQGLQWKRKQPLTIITP